VAAGFDRDELALIGTSPRLAEQHRDERLRILLGKRLELELADVAGQHRRQDLRDALLLTLDPGSKRRHDEQPGAPAAGTAGEQREAWSVVRHWRSSIITTTGTAAAIFVKSSRRAVNKRARE